MERSRHTRILLLLASQLAVSRADAAVAVAAFPGAVSSILAAFGPAAAPALGRFLDSSDSPYLFIRENDALLRASMKSPGSAGAIDLTKLAPRYKGMLAHAEAELAATTPSKWAPHRGAGEIAAERLILLEAIATRYLPPETVAPLTETAEKAREQLRDQTLSNVKQEIGRLAPREADEEEVVDGATGRAVVRPGSLAKPPRRELLFSRGGNARAEIGPFTVEQRITREKNGLRDVVVEVKDAGGRALLTRKYTGTGIVPFQFGVSADSRYLTVVAEGLRKANRLELYRIEHDDGGNTAARNVLTQPRSNRRWFRPLYRAELADGRAVAWSPDHRTAVFAVNVNNGRNESDLRYYLFRAKTGAVTELGKFANPQGSGHNHALWSPDSRYFGVMDQLGVDVEVFEASSGEKVKAAKINPPGFNYAGQFAALESLTPEGDVLFRDGTIKRAAPVESARPKE